MSTPQDLCTTPGLKILLDPALRAGATMRFMNKPHRLLNPAQASAALGVSAKGLRLYKQNGLLSPDRTQKRWRAYDAKAMKRAAEIVALRGIGLSLAQVARVLDGSTRDIDAAFSAHEARLYEQGQQVAAALERVRSLRVGLEQGMHATAAELTEALALETPLQIGFALPWPWNGEWFALGEVPRLAFITGPLGSGKTRFAQKLAEATTDAAFIGLDRLTDAALRERAVNDPLLADRIEQRLTWLVEDGGARSDALTALVAALESATASVLVIDMVEEGLDAETQIALIAHVRLRGAGKRALFLMTRSSLILDPEALDPADAIIMCPANHSPPFRVVPYPGGRGYEAVATCVALPEVRARTAGVIAFRPSGD